jgi:hypothetical protein
VELLVHAGIGVGKYSDGRRFLAGDFLAEGGGSG